MSKIYVVTKGDFSGYHILGVTTDFETAQHIQNVNMDDWGMPMIEEYEDGKMNKEYDGWLKHHYLFCFDVKNNKIWKSNVYDDKDIWDWKKSETVDKNDGLYKSSSKLYKYIAIESDKPYRTVVKIAQDKYYQWKAEWKGVA